MSLQRDPEDSTDDRQFLQFWSLAIRLKRVRRQGWIDRGVDDPESSADHSWGVALLAWLLAHKRPELDNERVLLLALLHDLPEAIAGDATPFDQHRDEHGRINVDHLRLPPTYPEESRTAKHDAERAALETLIASLDTETATVIRAVWNEYEAAQTPEARFVRQIDKLETLLQAEMYLRGEPNLVIDSFRLGTRRDITDAVLARLLSELPSPPETEE